MKRINAVTQERPQSPLSEMNASIYLKIVKTRGVIGLFCNGGKPAIIPDQELDTLMSGSMAGSRVLPQSEVTSPQHPRN